MLYSELTVPEQDAVRTAIARYVSTYHSNLFIANYLQKQFQIEISQEELQNVAVGIREELKSNSVGNEGSQLKANLFQTYIQVIQELWDEWQKSGKPLYTKRYKKIYNCYDKLEQKTYDRHEVTVTKKDRLRNPAYLRCLIAAAKECAVLLGLNADKPLAVLGHLQAQGYINFGSDFGNEWNDKDEVFYDKQGNLIENPDDNPNVEITN